MVMVKNSAANDMERNWRAYQCCQRVNSEVEVVCLITVYDIYVFMYKQRLVSEHSEYPGCESYPVFDQTQGYGIYWKHEKPGFTSL